MFLLELVVALPVITPVVAVTSVVEIPTTAHLRPFVSIIMAFIFPSYTPKVLTVKLGNCKLSARPNSNRVKIFLTISIGTKQGTTVL